jgi:membrane-bound lytic murein transglycosylase D
MSKKYILIPTLIITLLFLANCATRIKPVAQPINTYTEPAEEELPPIENKIIQETAVTEPLNPIEEKKEEVQDPEEVMEEAMNTYLGARIAWDQGDLDTAITALDEAYNLILQIAIPPDSPLIQEKNDLRLLIARRIQEVYASQATAIGENHQTIPLVENKYVLREIKSFQTTEKKSFQEGYKRSGRYRQIILEKLRKEGLPEELSWMPMIESWFKIRAYSRARALGLWQFIASTGYRYGLKRDRWIDERMDPEKATQAAVKYLKELHSWFGDWTTALAAYNCGEFRVRRVIKAQRINYLDNFWDLYPMLPRETSRFVPRFIATLLIVNDQAKYEMDLPTLDPPIKYDSIEVNRPIKLTSFSSKLGFPDDEIADLNPELRHKSTPDHNYNLKVPYGYQEEAAATVNSLSRWIPPEATYAIHYVRRGETVSQIASRYRTSISSIARLNSLSRNYLIRPGQRLKVPSQGGRSYSSSRSLDLTKEGNKLVYKVKRGDSLYLIANSFRTTIQKIKSLNSLKNSNLAIGQKLIIQNGTPKGSSFYIVKSGDSPYLIANKYGMNLNVLLKLNGLSSRSKIYPGQKLLVTADK